MRNNSGRPARAVGDLLRRMGAGRRSATTRLHVVTEIDRQAGALLARNRFKHRIRRASRLLRSVGRAAPLHRRPRRVPRPQRQSAARRRCHRVELSGRVGAGLDPCGAMQVDVQLAAGEETRSSSCSARRRIARSSSGLLVAISRTPRSSTPSCAEVTAYWDDARRRAGRHARPGLDLLPNRWLLYQMLPAASGAARLSTSRAAPSGSATSCRTSMALVHRRPELARATYSARRCAPVREGDVQHWWHPPSGRGVRTRISDD